ncbi:MAG: hypothetical protein ACK2T4_05970 [Candidatus Promineifilaceae bacterium]|jgi:hypothetical protein
MSFDWLKNFQQNIEKEDDYAEKTLAAYRLGMRANGSIVGVRITADPDGCAACKQLDPDATYHPDEAPHLPLANCDRARSCSCVYRPVMTYQIDDHE